MAFKLQALDGLYTSPSRSSLQVCVAHHFPSSSFYALFVPLKILARGVLVAALEVCDISDMLYLLVLLCSAFVNIFYFSLIYVLSSIVGGGEVEGAAVG
jgi:hypothetical protein